jgi:hypothetical protein
MRSLNWLTRLDYWVLNGVKVQKFSELQRKKKEEKNMWIKKNWNCIKIGILSGVSMLLISCSVLGIRSEETPKYEVITNEGDKEIRSYAGYIVAKTTVKGDYRQSQGDAFRILAGYIFGKNEKKQKIAMTAPVTQEKSSESEKIAMTAPVVQSESQDGWVMTFSMPAKYSMTDLPTPQDKRVVLEEVPPKLMGVIRYSGLARPSTNNQMAEELRSWLASKVDYEIVAGPSIAGYDPPWTIPLFRRNEAMFEIRLKK